ncbi:MAG: hypothetical protein JXB85_04110 [Anaerolineales bacterium]|nr:hypothetical protein [Anaerolineales bacterium]
MPALEQDLSFFEAGVDELADFLLSNELFWPLSSGRCELPRLTVGGLLLAQARLRARVERFRLERCELQLEATRVKWRVAWEAKSRLEARTRLDLWTHYLSDYRLLPEEHADRYQHEVQWRVMLHLLKAQLPAPIAETEILVGLDQVLQAGFLPGDFVWEVDLVPAFPRDPYWYLYGLLKT